MFGFVMVLVIGLLEMMTLTGRWSEVLGFSGLILGTDGVWW